jgi:methyl-accepting chemotaxis protein
MSQLSKATQQNASASEELAATSEELSGQAEQLQQSVAFFSLGDDAPAVRKSKDDGDIVTRRKPAPTSPRPPAVSLNGAAKAASNGAARVANGNFRPY